MLYLINVTAHVLAALVWLGGMFFLALVGAPVLRQVEDPRLRGRLFAELGRRFRGVGWVCIGVLLVTGLANLWFRGVLSADGVGSAAFWASAYGRSLAWKLGSVALMITVSAVHDFVHGPAASRATPGSPEAMKARRVAALLARANAILGIVVVIAAVRLARGM